MQQTDDELAGLLKTWDERAFEALYERHAAGLLRHLSNLLNNQQEAEELLHECMLLMIQKIGFYAPRPELKQSFKAWLYRLSTNRAIDEVRKRKARQTKETEAGPEVPRQEELYLSREQERLIGELLKKLPPLQRTLLGLRVQDDLSYQEISVICGKDVNSVKQALFQARKNLKDLLSEHGEII